MDVERLMFERYGPLLTLPQVAEVFGRKPGALRMALSRDSEVSKPLNAAKMKIGRRVYFRIADIAELVTKQCQINVD